MKTLTDDQVFELAKALVATGDFNNLVSKEKAVALGVLLNAELEDASGQVGTLKSIYEIDIAKYVAYMVISLLARNSRAKVSINF